MDELGVNSAGVGAEPAPTAAEAAAAEGESQREVAAAVEEARPLPPVLVDASQDFGYAKDIADGAS